MNHPARLLLFLLLILCIPLAACAEAVESPRASASAPANPAGTARGRSPDRQTRRRVPEAQKPRRVRRAIRRVLSKIRRKKQAA